MTTSAENRRFAEVGSFMALVIHGAGRKAAVATTLILVVSMTEWAGLILLVPLLALTGLDVGGGTVGRIADATRDVLSALGVPPHVLAVLAIYLVVVVLRAVVQRAQTMAAVDLERTILVHLRGRLYSALMRARWAYLSRLRATDLLHALNSQCLTVSHATNTLVGLVTGVVVSAVYLAVAMKLSAVMTLLVLVSGVVLLILLRHGSRRARDAGARMNRVSSALLGAVSEHLGGVKTVKSYTAEGRNAVIYSELNTDVARTYRETQRNYAAVRMWYDAGAATILVGLLYISIEVLALSTAEILLLVLLFGRLVPRFSGLQQSYQVLMHAMPSFAAVMQRLEEAEANAEGPPREDGEAVGSGDVRLVDVRFDYRDGRSKPALGGVSFVIPANRTTALVGPSGGGKTTIADIVMGLLTPDSGAVMISGDRLHAGNLHAWRSRIGYVTQDTFLFHDSVRANLLWACPEANEAEMWQALRMAAADAFVRALPQGLDTVVGDRGVLISGGERQRLALARALLRKPALLILDEATSALDSENERRIQQAIEQLKGRLTILIITHRLSTVRSADTIHVVEHGTVVESGSWQELTGRDSRFAELCSAQGIERAVVSLSPASSAARVAVS